MRATVTLDPDVYRLLKTHAHKQGTSLKVALNEAVRQSLGPKKKASDKTHTLLPPHSSGLRPGFEWDNLKAQAADLEIDEFIARRRRLEKKMRISQKIKT